MAESPGSPRSLESLEERMAALRAAVRDAVRARDKAAAAQARQQLRAAEDDWYTAVEAEAEADGPPAAVPAPRPGARIPVREQVHQALTVLGAPAPPKLISAVHEAFFAEPIVNTKLASLRRDEERSFAAQGHSRPYYICAALTHDRLAPARGLLAVSTWLLPKRIVGPLSPRCDFLTHAIRVAEHVRRIKDAGHEPSAAAWHLLRRFAVNIPDAHEGYEDPAPPRVVQAAQAEAKVHAAADAADRAASAERARAQLTPAQQLFGAAPLNVTRTARNA